MVYHRDLNELGNEKEWRAFWKHDYYKDDKKITKDEYFSYVRRRLKRSFYPRQINDFFFLRMPDKFKNHKDYTKKEIPVDWLLAPIVEYLWDKGIMTINLDQGSRDYNHQEPQFELPVFINIYYSKKALAIVKKLKVKHTIEKHKFIKIEFEQSELPRIYKELDLETPDINRAFRGGLVWQNFSKNKKTFKYEDLEDEFTEMVEYPDFFEWKGSYHK